MTARPQVSTEPVGVLANPFAVIGLDARAMYGAAWLRGSDVLRLPGGSLHYLPPTGPAAVTVPAGEAGAGAALVARRSWLTHGVVPGRRDEHTAAERSLLFLRALLRPNGALLSAPPAQAAAGVAPGSGPGTPGTVGPVDAGFAAVAFAGCGHLLEAAAIVRFLGRVQRHDGNWPGRIAPDSPATWARALQDGRPRAVGPPPVPGSVEAAGWFCWAAWHLGVLDEDRRRLVAAWPAVRRAADAGARALGVSQLPGPPAVRASGLVRHSSLGPAAAVRVGLRAASRIAAQLGHQVDQRRFALAAGRLDAAIWSTFFRDGVFHRTARGAGPDPAVTWLAPPFRRPDKLVAAAVRATSGRLGVPGGSPAAGARSGRREASTAVTAAFALAAAASRDPDAAGYRRWLLAHRTTLDAFPAAVTAGEGAPAGPAPSARTHALFLLGLLAEEASLPIP